MGEQMQCTGSRICVCEQCLQTVRADEADEMKRLMDAPMFTTFSIAKGTWTTDEMKAAVEHVRKLHEPFKRHTEIVAMPARLVEKIGEALYAIEPLRAKLAEARALLERLATVDGNAFTSEAHAEVVLDARNWLAANPEAK